MFRPERHSAAARFALLGPALVLCAACGKKGSPLPPLPRGPLPPAKVAARQIGGKALVAFGVPEARGPRPSQHPIRAELIRVTYPPGLEPQTDPDAFRRRGELVGQVGADPLPSGTRVLVEDSHLADLPGRGTGWTVRYAVRVRDRRGRPSALVVADDLVLLQPVAAPRALSAEPTADGVRLVWEPPEPQGDYAYNVYRSTPGGPWPEPPLNPEPLTDTAYLDTDVVTETRYIYTVRVALDPDTISREGEPSDVVELVARDLFAPSAPAGLVAVQEGLAVRLFWDPNPERDLGGYRIERQLSGSPWTAVGPERVEQASFLDTDVEVGQRLAYRVTAVDRAEPPNQSPPSDTVELELLAEPVAPGPVRP